MRGRGQLWDLNAALGTVVQLAGRERRGTRTVAVHTKTCPDLLLQSSGCERNQQTKAWLWKTRVVSTARRLHSSVSSQITIYNVGWPLYRACSPQRPLWQCRPSRNGNSKHSFNGTSPQRVALRCRLLATRSSRDRQSLDRAVAERIATTILALRGTEWRRLPEFASGSVGPEC